MEEMFWKHPVLQAHVWDRPLRFGDVFTKEELCSAPPHFQALAAAPFVTNGNKMTDTRCFYNNFDTAPEDLVNVLRLLPSASDNEEKRRRHDVCARFLLRDDTSFDFKAEYKDIRLAEDPYSPVDVEPAVCSKAHGEVGGIFDIEVKCLWKLRDNRVPLRASQFENYRGWSYQHALLWDTRRKKPTGFKDVVYVVFVLSEATVYIGSFNAMRRWGECTRQRIGKDVFYLFGRNTFAQQSLLSYSDQVRLFDEMNALAASPALRMF